MFNKENIIILLVVFATLSEVILLILEFLKVTKKPKSDKLNTKNKI